MENRKLIVYSLTAIMIVSLVGLALILASRNKIGGLGNVPNFLPVGSDQLRPASSSVGKFASEDEFRAYLKKSEDNSAGFGGMLAGNLSLPEFSARQDTVNFKGTTESSVAQRVSQTNVRTLGVDEADLVKTDGKEIYYSRKGYGNIYPLMGGMPESKSVANPCFRGDCGDLRQPENNTLLINAFPPMAMKKDGKIDDAGNLLLFEDMLIVFGDSKITAYDIKDKSNPKEIWENEIKGGSQLQQARKLEGRLYITQSTMVDRSSPCPVEPLMVGGVAHSIACTDIYYPKENSSARSTISVLELNPKTGKVKNSISFLGGDYYGYGSTVYLGKNNLYIGYPLEADHFTFMLNFYRENKDLIAEADLRRLEKVATYDLSQAAKLTELNQVISNMGSGKEDRGLKIRSEVANRQQEYFKKHKRELTKTGIVKIGLDKLNMLASGEIPGALLNEFSLDEYQGNLRVATTVGQATWSADSPSAGDLYVLNDKLEKVGELQDMGTGEKIYSARLVGDRGYVVTFRQTDPFYVLDLSDPKKPQQKGELKIPGYSSYLHPLSDKLILGIGKEDSKVKLSLFDVSTASEPREVSKYVLDEYWSEALNNHRAFLADTEKGIFFLPGGNGGYVFSYQGDELKIQVATSGNNVERALYLDNYLYVLSREKIVVYDERTWEKMKEFSF